MARVSRSVQYRYLNCKACSPVESLTDTTLMGMIRYALRQKRRGDVLGKRARARIADLDQNGQIVLLNGFKGDNSSQVAFSGQLVLYREGIDVPTIEEKLEKETNRFDIVQYHTPEENKPIEGVLYFVVIGNHVGLITSNAVRNRWLERYLTWLLKDAADVIRDEDYIELNARISLKGDKAEPLLMQEIALRPQASSPEEIKSSRLVRREKGISKATVLDILKVLGIGDEAGDDLAKSVPDDGTLEGEFRVFIKKGRFKWNFDKDTLDHAFRNIDDENPKWSGKSGKISDGMLYLAETVQVEATGSWLDAENAIEQIVEQMYRWAKQGRIDLSI